MAGIEADEKYQTRLANVLAYKVLENKAMYDVGVPTLLNDARFGQAVNDRLDAIKLAELIRAQQVIKTAIHESVISSDPALSTLTDDAKLAIKIADLIKTQQVIQRSIKDSLPNLSAPQAYDVAQSLIANMKTDTQARTIMEAVVKDYLEEHPELLKARPDFWINFRSWGGLILGGLALAVALLKRR